MGKYTFQPQKEHYEKFLGRKIKLITKTGDVDGMIDKVRILELDNYNLYVYVRDIDGNLHKVKHEDIIDIIDG